MIKKSTVVIIGAGASAEFGMPTGPELQFNVQKLLDFNRPEAGEFFNQIGAQLGATRQQEFIKVAPHLHKIVTRFKSIDEALHFERSNKTLVELGKLCIAYEILRAERGSSVSAMQKGALNKADNTWARHFLDLALSGATRDDIGDIFRKVTIINFNYDRILEQYLFNALQTNYDLSAGDAANLLSPSSFKILRPYGSIGRTSWQPSPNVPFGHNGIGLDKISHDLRTYTEEINSDGAQLIKSTVAAAKAFLVIGFGYHKQNIEIISALLTTERTGKSAFMTVYGIPTENYETIARATADALRTGRPEFYNKRGEVMLRELWQTISFACG